MQYVSKLFVFTISIAIMRAGWFATIPFLTIYLHDNTTQNPLLIGALIGSGWLSASIGGVFGGVLVDKADPKRIMIISLILSSIALLGYSIVNPKDIVMIVLLNILIGLLIAFFEIGGKTYISANFTSKLRIHAFNFRYTAINIGAAIGPYIGAWFSSHNPRFMFIFTSLTYCMVAILLMLFLDKSKSETVKYDLKMIFKNIVTHKELMMLTYLSFLCFLALSQLETTLPQFMSNHVENYTMLYATLLSINAIIVIFTQIPFGFVIGKFNQRYLAYLSSILFACSFAILAFARHPGLFILAISTFALAEVIFSSLINLLVDKIAAPGMVGVYYGITNLGMLGLFCGPIIGGAFLKYFNGSVLYVALSCIMLSPLFIYNKLLTIPT